MMKMTGKGLTVLLSTAVLVAVVAIALGAGAARAGRAERPVAGTYFPASQIISFDNTIGRLDTATGAVYRLRGNLDNPGAKLTWERRVPPVTASTSGLLEIQRATFNRPDAIFLVDIVTGKTWILRRRASSNSAWAPVESAR
jgi:hypothetical protein